MRALGAKVLRGMMFEKYTVRKAVILKYKVQYYDNCTRYNTLSIP